MGAVVVAAVGAGLEVGRRDRARRVPQAAPPPRPRVRGAARLQPDPGRRQLAEELRHLAASHLPAQHCLLALVDPMHLKDVLGGIKANPDNHHWAAPLAALFNHHSLAHSMPSGAVHPNINAGLWNIGSGLAAARHPGMTVEGTGYIPSRTSGFLRVPMPVISISQTSPCFGFAGVPSVPIHTTSPGESVRYWHMRLRILST